MSDIVVSAFYHFTAFPDHEKLQAPIHAALNANGVLGTVLLADEGINGTVAGTQEGIDRVMAFMRTLPGCADLEHKESTASDMPFYRLKVRLKKEIVAMGVPEANPSQQVGTYVDAQDWNALIADPDVVVIDTRNDYEVSIGAFDRAVNPETESFRDFPAWFRENREALDGKKVAMYCTGGIRCEKATSLLKLDGIDEVYHLKGGILKYLETVPESESTWKGECFVFDHRVAIGHGLKQGSYDMCHACRRPITDDDKKSTNYVPGVSCDYCVDKSSDAQKKRYAQRQRQMELAEERGKPHIGVRQHVKDGFEDDWQ